MVGIRSFGFVVAVAAYTAAQSTQQIATCTNATYQWSFNSLGQSPCVMTSWLGGVCNAGSFNVPPLQTGLVYLGPSPGAANGCRCSTVFYSVISACALCQSDDFLKWSAYNVNCSTVYPGIFPFDIPAGTKVPHWAYLDVVPSDQFLPLAAQAAAGGPESTNVPQSTTTTSAAGSASSKAASSSATSISAPTTSSAASPHSSNTGAIAGGVVGGVVGLALVAALVFWWMRRRRAQPGQSVLVDPMITSAASPAAISFNQTTPLVGATSPKLYDPSDPSTFPSTPATSGTYSMQEYQPYSHANANPAPGSLYSTTATPGPHYTGMPEL